MSQLSTHGQFIRAVIGLIAFSIFLRWGSFFISVINHDESTYIVIADELLRGKVYLKDVFDTKPVGLYWLFQGLVWLSGDSIILLRLFAAVFIGLTAGVWWWTARRVTKSTAVAWATGITYIFLCSTWTYFGISPNTEIYFNLFTAVAIALMVSRVWRSNHNQTQSDWLTFSCVGVVLGLAAIIKPVVAAESLAMGLFLLWRGWKTQQLRQAIFARCLPMTIAFCLPLLMVYSYYSSKGLLDALYFYNYELTKRYPVDKTILERVIYVGEYLRFFPVLIVAMWPYSSMTPDDISKPIKTYRQFLFLLGACVLIFILLPGKSFGHYFIQLHPVAAALFGLWFLPGRNEWPKLRAFFTRYGKLLLIATSIGLSLAYFFKYQTKYDQPKAIAEWLNDRLEEGDQVFMENYHQIVYHLIDRPVPTPYVHSSLLFYDHHVEALELDLETEAQRLIENSNLVYVVRRKRQPELYDNALTQAIDTHFKVVKDFDEELIILKRVQPIGQGLAE
ncbi:MAG: phospholipid carrier-dependent glycosyltransferase [Bacteroidota bacterium]